MRPYPQFLTLSQNVDGLSAVAGHPRRSIEYLHGSLFKVRCVRSWCRYERDDVADPIVPALAVDDQHPHEADGWGSSGGGGSGGSGSDKDGNGEAEGWRRLGVDELPKCPQCRPLFSFPPLRPPPLFLAPHPYFLFPTPYFLFPISYFPPPISYFLFPVFLLLPSSEG